MRRLLCIVLFGISFLLEAGVLKVSAIPSHTRLEDSVEQVIYDYRTDLGDPHIVGGKEAEPHSHPHQVALELSLNIDQGFCGGSLVADQWVLTAAHCTNFANAKWFVLVVGAHRIREDENSSQTIPIDEVILHPEWNRESLSNDISLIRLKFPAKLNEFVQPIRLPSVGQKSWSFWLSTATLTGWGYTTDGSDRVSDVLRTVDSRVVTNWYCYIRYGFSLIQNSNICVSGWWKKGSCNGDSGGPLSIMESDGNRTLIGVSSFGVTFGCEKSWPVAYTRVTSYLDWIHNQTGIPLRD